MATPTKYTFSIADDFGGSINTDTLVTEIHNKSTILTDLDGNRIDTTGDVVDVWFKDALDSGEQAALDEVVAAHDSSATDWPPDITQIVNDDATTVWNQPQTSNKTPLFNPNIIPPGYLLYITGAFDDIAEEDRGEGALIALQKTDNGETTLEGRFLEHVYVLGGDFGTDGAGYKDWVSMEIYAPASAPTSASGVGNANKVATGLGFNVIVPAPGDDGDWTVDGSTLEGGEINQNLVPVPSSSGTGYWNWDPTADPSITPVSNPAAPDGNYNLYDAALPIARQANKVPMLHSGDCCPATIKGKKILPHWKLKFTLHREASGTVSVGLMMKVCRLATT